jgi:hypothetical protein
MKTLKFILCFAAMLSFLQSKAQGVYTIGPMLHFNIGDKPMRTSFGIEFAYWNIDHTPYGFDVGFDCQKGKFRLYSEMQTGIGVMGMSSGPFIEFRKDALANLGLQGSVWANYILGMDLRFRFSKGQDYFAPGIYAKYLWMKGQDDDNHHSYHDWDD